jgi:cytochrome P450
MLIRSPLLPIVVSSNRLTLRLFTFSNGVTVPAGTHISIPSSVAHRDERIFTNPDVFDGYRRLAKSNRRAKLSTDISTFCAFWVSLMNHMNMSFYELAM